MRRRILIIDDDVMTLQVLKKYLEASYDVVLENSGYRVAERIDEYDADLILLDVEMPVMNGLEVFGHIKISEKFKNVPVLFLSGVSNPTIVRDAMLGGAAGYFIKTSTKSELINKVESIFAERMGEETAVAVHEKSKPVVLAVEQDPAVLRSVKSACAGRCDLLLATSYMRAASQLDTRNIDAIILGNITAGSAGEDVEAKLRERANRPDIKIFRMDSYPSVNQIIEEIDN